MKLSQLFIGAFNEPKKLAAFRLLPIGTVFRYVFLFIFMFTAISFTRFLFADEGLFDVSSEIIDFGEAVGVLIYPIAFILQLVISTFYVFIRISIFAYIGTWLLKIMKRRGDFRFMWNTTAIALTVPILLTMIFDFFPAFQTVSFIVTSLVHIGYLVAAIQYYPKSLQ